MTNETRRQILGRLPIVFGLGASEAAAAIGVSVTTFYKLVDEGRMPGPRVVGTRRIWDVDELRAAFKALPREWEAESDEWADVG